MAASVHPPPLRDGDGCAARRRASTRRLRGAITRYCLVGASGYVVNSLLFWALDRVIVYPVAFAGAFAAAATSNFALNRLWTFRSSDAAISAQYLRFVTVSGMALALDLLVLASLVEGLGAPKLAAAAVAIVTATPASFAGNRLWTFREASAGRPKIPHRPPTDGSQTSVEDRAGSLRAAA